MITDSIQLQMSRENSTQEAAVHGSIPAGHVQVPVVHNSNSNVNNIYGSGIVTNHNHNHNHNQFVNYVDARPPPPPAAHSR